MAMGHIRNESEEQIAYAKDMFETIFKELEGKILLILPD